MEKVGVVRVNDRELILLLSPNELNSYIARRRLKLVGPRIVDLAEALEVRPQQATGILSGRVPFGPKMIARLNAIDPDYQLVELIGVIRKSKAAKTDVDI